MTTQHRDRLGIDKNGSNLIKASPMRPISTQTVTVAGFVAVRIHMN
jgi:hypothetical protein